MRGGGKAERDFYDEGGRGGPDPPPKKDDIIYEQPLSNNEYIPDKAVYLILVKDSPGVFQGVQEVRLRDRQTHRQRNRHTDRETDRSTKK